MASGLESIVWLAGGGCGWMESIGVSSGCGCMEVP